MTDPRIEKALDDAMRQGTHDAIRVALDAFYDLLVPKTRQPFGSSAQWRAKQVIEIVYGKERNR